MGKKMKKALSGLLLAAGLLHAMMCSDLQ